MIVQFNTDHNFHGGEKAREPMIARITDDLSHYSSHITRVEAHLKDEDGSKHGADDKRCLLEARVEGKPPVVVSCHAQSNEAAVAGALDKLKISLEKTLGRSEHRS